jgi:hypothetical protein
LNNTEYLALEQPEETEFYDIEVANRNMKKIDDKFKKTDEEKCVSFYSVCNTAADVAAKIVDCPGFVKKKGSTVKVEFKYSNKADNVRLNVNETGIASVIYRSNSIDADMLVAGKIYEFLYNGSSYTLVSQPVYDTVGGYFNLSVNSGITLAGISSRKIARKTYAVMGTLNINLTQSNLAEFQTAWNTYGTVENWYQLLKFKHSSTKELILDSPRYVGSFRAYDKTTDGQFYRKPLNCSLAIDTNGNLKMSGNEDYTFKAGDKLQIPFNFSFSE